MGAFWQDLRYAARLLRKNPGFAAVPLLVLALGIGANTAVFSLVNAVLLRPLSGVPDPGELVTLERLQRGRVLTSFGYPDYLDYRDQSQSFAGLVAHCVTPLSFRGGTTERVTGDLVTGNYFTILGVKPALGRLLLPEDDLTPGGHPVAVVSYGFWQRALGSDPNVLGRAVELNGYSFTVVGVAAPDFGGTSVGAPVDVWLPLMMQVQAMPRTLGQHWFPDRSAGWLGIFGRLKPGVSAAQAHTEIETIARRLEQAYPTTNQGRSAAVRPGLGLSSTGRTSLGNFLGLLLASVFLLLLIACANVANILLVKASARRREIAMRLTLGASRGRLVRQLLTEGLLLSALAGFLGLLLAPWTADLIVAFQESSHLLRSLDLSLDLRVLGFTLMLSLLTGVLFGLAPALQAARPDLVAALKEGAPGSGRRSRLQSALIVAQVAISLVLLAGAGLAVRTMRHALTMDRGFDSENMVLMSVDLTIQGYSEAQGRSFYENLLKRLEAVPGVSSASLAKTVPPNEWSDRLSVFYEGQAPTQEVLRSRDDLGVRVELNRIAPHYFRTLGIPIRQGREFDENDREGTLAVAVINEKLARRLWPDENPLGKRLAVPFYSGPPRPPVEVVGVVRDTKHRSLLADAPPLVYLPVQQAYDGRATLVVRTATDPIGLVPAVRSQVAALDEDLPLYGVKTMSEQIASTLWQQRMAAGLIGIFGLLALLVAALGLYGVVAYSVAQRTHEIGVRVALGAQPADVLRLVLRQGLTLTLTGVALGLAAAFGLTRAMSGLIYGVDATDPLTLAVTSLLLIGVTLVASYAPARRAAKIDPLTALRHE